MSAFLAKELARLNSKVDLLVASPAKRTMQTAGFFAAALGLNESVIMEEKEIYEAATSDILSVVRQLPDTAVNVFLFGHNPSLTNIANLFSQKYIDNMPTCSIIRVEADVQHWKDFNQHTARQNGFWYPKDLID